MVVVRVVTLLDFGGVEKRMVNVATSVPAGVTLIFISLGKGGQASAEIEALGHTVICLNQAFKIPNFSLVFTLVRLFKKLKADVVHSSGAEANFHAQIAGYFAGVKKRISEEIGFPSHSFSARFIFKSVYAFSNRLVCISNAVAEKVISLKEVKKSKTTVVYNPIVIPVEIIQCNDEGEGFIFITVCRLTAVKNINCLIHAFAQLQKKHPSAKLYIVGDGPEKVALESLALQITNAGSTVFTGFKTNVYNELAKADVFILPSFSEGLGNAVMEAFMAGLPCIVSSVGGAAELVTPGINGWLINPAEETDILQKMLASITRPKKELQKMGAHGRQNIIHKFSLARHWDMLMQIYTG